MIFVNTEVNVTRNFKDWFWSECSNEFLLQKRVSNEASWTGQRNFHQSNRFLVNARVLNIWWLMKYFGFIILMRSVFTLICNWWAWNWVVHHNSWANPYGPRQYSQWWPPGHHISGRSFTTGSDFHRTWQVSLTSSAPYGAWCRTSIYRVHNQILKITNVFAFFLWINLIHRQKFQEKRNPFHS